jgi:hypothetical protein
LPVCCNPVLCKSSVHLQHRPRLRHKNMAIQAQGVAICHTGDEIADRSMELLFLFCIMHRATLGKGIFWAVIRKFMHQKKAIEFVDDILRLFKLVMHQLITILIRSSNLAWRQCRGISCRHISVIRPASFRCNALVGPSLCTC